MGGVVNIAIRFKSGEAICQERWTNNTPFWFKHPKMFAGDEEYVREYIAMTANNDHRADPFAPGMPTNPVDSEYGLVVFDYMTNTILDNNHYSTYNHLDMINFVRFHEDEDDEDEDDHRRALCEAGLVHVRKTFYVIGDREKGDRDQKTRVEIDPNPISLEDAIKLSKEDWRAQDWRIDGVEPKTGDERCHTDFFIDTSPMKYIKFDNHRGPESRRLYREKLAEIGFPMNSRQGLNKTLKTNMSMTAIQKARKAWHDNWLKENQERHAEHVEKNRLGREAKKQKKLALAAPPEEEQPA